MLVNALIRQLYFNSLFLFTKMTCRCCRQKVQANKRHWLPPLGLPPEWAQLHLLDSNSYMYKIKKALISLTIKQNKTRSTQTIQQRTRAPTRHAQSRLTHLTTGWALYAPVATKNRNDVFEAFKRDIGLRTICTASFYICIFPWQRRPDECQRALIDTVAE